MPNRNKSPVEETVTEQGGGGKLLPRICFHGVESKHDGGRNSGCHSGQVARSSSGCQPGVLATSVLPVCFLSCKGNCQNLYPDFPQGCGEPATQTLNVKKLDYISVACARSDQRHFLKISRTRADRFLLFLSAQVQSTETLDSLYLLSALCPWCGPWLSL